VNDLLLRPALELAGLIRTGEVSARELTEACLRRIDQLQPEVNAFTHVAHEAALAAADQVEPGDPRPFAGVPLAVKDNRPVLGMPLTMCSDLFGDFMPRRESFLVRRLREAGFVIVGKTALPEMGILPTTESRRFGPTRNPWDLERTPGGSSGGSAAAVAAGMVPIAHGNDGGGSTRIPASCCGLVGLKASRGRVSVGPDAGDSLLAIDGVLTRTVADTAAVLDVLAGYEPGDATWAPAPERPFAEATAADPGRLRIGLALTPPLAGAPVEEPCLQAAGDAAELLGSLGHQVEEIEPPWSNEEVLPDFTRVFGPMVSMVTMIGGMIRGREPVEDDVEPLTWLMYDHARQQDALAFLAAESRVKALAREVVSFLHGYDVVLSPALARLPVPIGEIHGRGPEPWEHYRRSGYFTPYTAIFNVTGLPAISVPLYHSEQGLPVAIQLGARPLREDLLLSLAAQLESAEPWAGRVAPLARGESGVVI
jgi:amidase